VEKSRAIIKSRNHTGEPSPESNRNPDPDLGQQHKQATARYARAEERPNQIRNLPTADHSLRYTRCQDGADDLTNGGERMAFIDSHPHPRVLFVGWDENDPDLREMEALVATPKVWDGLTSSVRWEDWDAAVTRSKFTYTRGPHIVDVLAFGVRELPHLIHSGRSVCSGQLDQVSPQFQINDDLPDEIRRLVRDDLAPWLRSRPRRPLMALFDQYSVHPITLDNCGEDELTWFAQDPDGTLIAGAYPTTSTGSVWCVPFVPEHPSRWLAAALKEWHRARPDAFPDRDPWQDRPHWSSREELRARARLKEAETELEALVAARRVEIATLGDELRTAQGEAERGVRRLVAAQGDAELTEEVALALSELGFEVEKRDEVIPAGMAKQEDLRVSLPGGRPGIVEVKGYTRGAKQGDLMKITKYAMLFEREMGHPPERQWYVCNQFLATDPDQRPQILAGADDDLVEFAAGGGAVIDTRELFKLVRAVEDGWSTVEDARTSLWNSPPRYVAPIAGSTAETS